ncbi:Lysine methyltransferase [Rhodospirillaceae bacterium LM-1]|nr:Lysine methyltransferase [Rhodospirillaceae bacterium LM-1]
MLATSDMRKKVRIVVFEGRGRGIVAAEPIKKGELIERSPVLVIPETDRHKIDESILFTYVFMWEKDTTEEDLYSRKGRAGVTLGYTSLCNHSNDPNADFDRLIDESLLDLFAVRDIAEGEEITIDYQMTLWFPGSPSSA